tara:strand:- start:215 stop:451 length:237 start_codon:yes stop_codon:yes gene_type:complete
MGAVRVGVQVSTINTNLDVSRNTVLKVSRIETKFSKKKALESMALVESSMSRGSFLILGLDVWRNVSLNEMRRYGPKF